VERSLRKLGADHIDLLLIHRPDPLMDPSKTGAVLEKLVKSGKVLSVGVSNFTTAGFSALQSKMAVPLAVNQIELSAKTTEPLFNGTVDNALERNLPLMAWSPLGGGGLFLGQDEQSIRLRHTIGDIAEERKVSPETILYAWLLCLPVTVLPITGTTRIGRLRSAVAALDLTLTRDEWYRVLAASRGFDVP
jgi:predicted oxidoreductase